LTVINHWREEKRKLGMQWSSSIYDASLNVMTRRREGRRKRRGRGTERSRMHDGHRVMVRAGIGKITENLLSRR